MNGMIITQGVQVTDLLEQMRSIVREEIKQVTAGQANEEKLLSPAEACKVFVPNISKSTLHNWSAKGLLQAHYIGGRKFYRLSEILEKMQTLAKYKV